MLRSLKGVYCDANLNQYLSFSDFIWETEKEPQIHKLYSQYLTLTHSTLIKEPFIKCVTCKMAFYYPPLISHFEDHQNVCDSY